MKSWRKGIAILPVLAAIMLLTRNVNWYGMGFRRPRAEKLRAGD
jgi:inner membrane protein involved in colicin E2 resistance